jgi:hypothetical protein
LRRKRAATATSSFVESPRKRWRSPSGAVTTRFLSWLAACVLDFTAERRAVLKACGDHLHAAVRALGLPSRLSSQHRAGGILGVP